MRRTSLKRQQRITEAAPARADLIARVGRCEWCGLHNVPLIVHEILRGTGYRQKALDQPYAQLVLCDSMDGACHPLMNGRPWAEQLAILKRSRPQDFCLPMFHALAQRNYPDLADVILWLKRLSFVPATTTTYAREFP